MTAINQREEIIMICINDIYLCMEKLDSIEMLNDENEIVNNYVKILSTLFKELSVDSIKQYGKDYIYSTLFKELSVDKQSK